MDGGLFHFYHILCSYCPHRWGHFTSYKLLILRTYRHFTGFCWLNYDRAFREHAATVKLTDWFAMNVQPFNYDTASAQVRTRPASANPVTSFRQRPLVALLVKLFTILGMRVAALLSILAVDSAMHVAGAVAIIVQLLVLLYNQLVLTLRILRNQSAGNAINCCLYSHLNPSCCWV